MTHLGHKEQNQPLWSSDQAESGWLLYSGAGKELLPEVRLLAQFYPAHPLKPLAFCPQMAWATGVQLQQWGAERGREAMIWGFSTEGPTTDPKTGGEKKTGDP